MPYFVYFQSLGANKGGQKGGLKGNQMDIEKDIILIKLLNNHRKTPIRRLELTNVSFGGRIENCQH